MKWKMKKAKLKSIRSLAAQFPKSIEEYQNVELLFGADLIKRGILQVEGKDVEPNKTFKNSSTKIRELNHYNRIKSMLSKGKSIEDYISWFKIHHDRMIIKYPKLFKIQENEKTA